MNDKLFQVNEWFNGYEVEHIPTGKTHWMSDGVDRQEIISLEADIDHEPPQLGTAAFRLEWEFELNLDPQGTLEAYFPEEVT